jgi:hypothetical protein
LLNSNNCEKAAGDKIMNSENLKNFQKGADDRRNYAGRPRKYVSTLVKSGYKLSEINSCITALLSLTVSELQAIQQSDQATVLEASISKALITSFHKGNLDAIETIISRRFGKAKEVQEVSIKPELVAARNMFFVLIHKEQLSQEKALDIVLTSAKNNGFELNPAEIIDGHLIP